MNYFELINLFLSADKAIHKKHHNISQSTGATHMSRDTVSCIAYLIGVNDAHFSQFDETVIARLNKSNDCKLIRTLCQLRTIMLTGYYEIERQLKRSNGRISATTRCKDLYDNLINKHGLDIELYSTSVKDYIKAVNHEIESRIDIVSPLFPSTTQKEVWAYIRNLFLYPSGAILKERKRFISERDLYPFGCYICWNPQKVGNVLENDLKLLSILFSDSGKTYERPKEEMIADIYSFAKRCNNVIIGIDCENVDCAAFYTALSQFKSDLTDKIEKVLLFDDTQLMSGWNFYHYFSIKTERIACPRIQNNKSTLDVKMSAYLTAAHIRDGIDGFILVTSDSDYWGLIDTIGQTAKFFVIGEKEKISSKNLSALDNERIPYCMLDDFDDSELREQIKEEIYRNEIRELLGRTKFNVDFFLNMLQKQTLYLSEEEKATFKQKMCNLKISFDANGKTIYDI